MNTAHARTVIAENISSAATVPWIARAQALRDGTPLLQTAADMGAPPGIIEAIKAAMPAGSTALNPELTGGSAALTAFVNFAADASLLLRLVSDSAILRIPLNARVLGLASDVTAAIVGEGAAIPMQSLQWTRTAIEPFKIGALIAFSDAAWRDLSSAGQSFISMQLRQAVGLAADRALFNRILVSMPTVTAPADDDAAILAGLRDLLDAVHVRGGARLHWGVSPAAANALATLATARVDLNPFDGALLGRPVTITSGLADRAIVLIDGRSVAGDVLDMQITSSSEAALEMRDDPIGNSLTPTGSTMVSLFQNNLSATKIVLTLGLETIRPTAAAQLTLEDAA